MSREEVRRGVVQGETGGKGRQGCRECRSREE